MQCTVLYRSPCFLCFLHHESAQDRCRRNTCGHRYYLLYFLISVFLPALYFESPVWKRYNYRTREVSNEYHKQKLLFPSICSSDCLPFPTIFFLIAASSLVPSPTTKTQGKPLQFFPETSRDVLFRRDYSPTAFLHAGTQQACFSRHVPFCGGSAFPMSCPGQWR